MLSKTTLTSCAVVAISLAFIAAPVSADYMEYNGMGLKSKVKIRAAGTIVHDKYINAGQMELNYQNTDYLGYCVDLDHYAGSCNVTELPVESLNNGDMVAYLFETYADSVSTNVQAAALQSAIWEVIRETSSNFDLSDGYFRISRNNPVRNLGNNMLAGMPDTYSPVNVLLVLHNPCKQDMLIGTNIPVPEPVTASVLAVGGILVLIRKKRRRC